MIKEIPIIIIQNFIENSQIAWTVDKVFVGISSSWSESGYRDQSEIAIPHSNVAVNFSSTTTTATTAKDYLPKRQETNSLEFSMQLRFFIRAGNTVCTTLKSVEL